MKISRKAQVLIAITALGLVATQTTATYAATKKITCYKGTTSKVVTGTNPKCPAGYTTTKPAAAPAKTTAAAPAACAGTSQGWQQATSAAHVPRHRTAAQ